MIKTKIKDIMFFSVYDEITNGQTMRDVNYDLVGFNKADVKKHKGVYEVEVNFKAWDFIDNVKIKNAYHIEDEDNSYLLLDGKKYNIIENELSLAEYELKKADEIKIYRQYSGMNDETYYFTFNENDINYVNQYPLEIPLTKENIALTVLDNQTIKTDSGDYYGISQEFTSKTQLMKLKKDELLKLLEKCYEVFLQVQEINKSK